MKRFFFLLFFILIPFREARCFSFLENIFSFGLLGPAQEWGTTFEVSEATPSHILLKNISLKKRDHALSASIASFSMPLNPTQFKPFLQEGSGLGFKIDFFSQENLYKFCSVSSIEQKQPDCLPVLSPNFSLKAEKFSFKKMSFADSPQDVAQKAPLPFLYNLLIDDVFLEKVSLLFQTTQGSFEIFCNTLEISDLNKNSFKMGKFSECSFKIPQTSFKGSFLDIRNILIDRMDLSSFFRQIQFLPPSQSPSVSVDYPFFWIFSLFSEKTRLQNVSLKIENNPILAIDSLEFTKNQAPGTNEKTFSGKIEHGVIDKEIFNKSKKFSEFFSFLGYNQLSFNSYYRINYIEKIKEINILLETSLEKAGKINFVFELANITEPLFKNAFFDFSRKIAGNFDDKTPGIEELLKTLQVKNLKIRYEDHSLTIRLLDSLAKKATKSIPEVIKTITTKFSAILIDKTKDEKFSLEIAETVKDFLTTPRTLNFSLLPLVPQPLFLLSVFPPPNVFNPSFSANDTP